MTRIACLHTAASNIAVFDDALGRAALTGLVLHHHVRADLLAAAERKHRLTPEIAAQTVDALRTLCHSADAVLLTCSTLGPAAETASSIPIIRVDAALAAEAVKSGGKVAVLCAVETTMEPTRRLFEAAAQATGARAIVHLVPGAWDAFKAGNQDRYLDLIARAAEQAFQAGATQVALAQASMAGARDRVQGRRPLDSPTASLAAAARALT